MNGTIENMKDVILHRIESSIINENLHRILFTFKDKISQENFINLFKKAPRHLFYFNPHTGIELIFPDKSIILEDIGNITNLDFLELLSPNRTPYEIYTSTLDSNDNELLEAFVVVERWGTPPDGVNLNIE